MKKRNQYRLSEDVLSNFKGRVYGQRMDLVTQIADYGSVLIVEDKKGNRFPVRKAQLIES